MRDDRQNMRLTSRDNARLKFARAVRDGRDDGAFVFVEGVRLCEEALQARLAIEEVFYREDLLTDSRGARLVAALGDVCPRLYSLNATLMQSIADTKTTQGVALIARQPADDAQTFTSKANSQQQQRAALFVVLHGIGNPANAGGILRAAEAAGATGVIATDGTVGLFAPKALRGAMGSSFRVPVWAGAKLAEIAAWLRARDVRFFCADAHAATAHTQVDWTRPAAIVFGAEGAGLTAAEISLTDQSIRIPMRAPVESLNVTVASAIVLFEAARQRDALR